MPKKNAKPRSEARAAEPQPEFDRADDIGLRGVDDSRRSASMGSEPSEEDIRMRAYQKYLERGGGHGNHFEDWITAERELKGR